MVSFHQASVAIAILLALSGCDAARNIGRTPEDRINEVRPALPETSRMRRSLEQTFADDASASAELQQELATRDRVRALTCGKGYSPSFYETDNAVSRKLTNQKCFDDYDLETVEWLKGKRLQRLLTMGPLRELPGNTLPMFATTGGINTIKFAAAAPIAVSTSNNSVEVLDVGSGESIFLDRALSQHPSSIAISPNGRVFSVGGTNAVSLRDADSGEVLFELPEYARFTWLDALTGIAIKRNQSAADLIDFANNGVAVPVRGVDAQPTRVVLLPGDQGEFLLSSYRSLVRYALKRNADGVEAILRDTRNGPPMTWSDNSGEPTIDGAWLVQASNELWITNLKTLETERIALEPFYGRAVGPMSNPDEVILFSGRGDSRPLVYSISNRTFAPVEDERFTAQAGYSALRTVFIPALKRVAVVTGSKVLVVDEIKRGPRYGLEALKQLLTEEQRVQQEKNAMAIAGREGFKLERVVDGIPVASGPLLAVAKDAQIEGVGVYESKYGSHGIGKPSVPGVVTVALQRSPQPIVLVLSSYEPVHWQISGARSANLKAVLLSSYKSSTVSGVDGLQVIQMGSHYAYEQGSAGFAGLQREVIKRTGKGIETFQGKYSGTSFIVGGR
jgi:hypothetical protein